MGNTNTQKAKKVEVKLSIDGDMYRARVESRGRKGTKSSTLKQELLTWLQEEFDELYLAMRKELDNGAPR